MDLEKEFGFSKETIEMKPDYEGKVVITLFRRNANADKKKAVLYIHGFNDYFFQTHLADKVNASGYNFYALELRKYGRSILPHQRPNDFRNYKEYFDDIYKSLDIIRHNYGNTKVVLMGHSTGGLLVSLFAHHYKNENIVDALILNSPFFEFNVSPLLLHTFIPLMTCLGKKFPGIPSPVGLDKGYGYSMHKSHYGEWDYELSLKPDAGFKIHASWIRGIHLAQKELQRGLNISIPVLVMYSGSSVKPGNYKPEMQHADSVLNVKDIEKYANIIGTNVEHAVFEGGVHDLVLSDKPVREKVLDKIAIFLNKC